MTNTMPDTRQKSGQEGSGRALRKSFRMGHDVFKSLYINVIEEGD